jgi:hypothetical protein
MGKTRISFPFHSLPVFISSFCIMVLELVASRLIANYLGSSLYTWTAVIGVILAGITMVVISAAESQIDFIQESLSPCFSLLVRQPAL